MEGSFQLNPDANPFIPGSLSLFADKAPEKQAESSSKGDSSGGSSDPVQYEENVVDPHALSEMLSAMFPDVSRDFIDELLKATEFEINLTLDMLHELNSQDVFHDDAEDTNDQHVGLSLPGGDYHCAEVSESSSNLNQDLQNKESATTSDVISVLPMSSNIDLLHSDLSLPDDEKSAGAATAK